MGDGGSDGGPREEIPLTLVDWVDAACDRFEAAWRAGARPRVEAFLEEAPEAARPALRRELRLLEQDLARRAGRGPGHGPGPDPDRTPDGGETVRGTPANGAAGPKTLPGGGRAGPPQLDLPGYLVLDEVGRGGMGVVYRVRDVRLNRVVALKMVLGGPQATPEVFARFQSEAETVARLQHPNVVRIHAVGEHQGLPYFEMEYVGGGSLAGRLDGTPWPPREAARLIEAAARGVEAVHRLGVVHRDLKPGNILIADDGTPKLGDFGLAKSLLDDSGLTRTDSVLGSPSYMAPEQAAGGAREAGPPADVYALGAVLYELLTGRPPFRAATVLETLRLLQTTEPVAPSRLVPGLPRDVETVCLKCLEKPPGRRYPSAGALADDLKRFLEHRPITARRIGPAGRLVRWCRRNPVVAGLSALVVVVLLAASGVSLAALVRARAAAANERRTLYYTRMNLLQLAWESGDTRRMQELVAPYAHDAGRDDLRGFEWYYWKRLAYPPAAELTGHRRPVDVSAFSPDGSTLATADERDVRLWDVRRALPLATLNPGHGMPCGLAFSPDGSTLAVGTWDGCIVLYDRDGRGPRATLRDGGERVSALTFADERTLVSAHDTGVNRTWDLATRSCVRTVRGTVPPPPRVEDQHLKIQALSRDGRWLAVGGYDGLVILRETGALAGPAAGAAAAAVRQFERLWRPGPPRTAPLETRIQAGNKTVRSLAFSDDGSLLALGGEDRTITLWDVPRKRVREVLGGQHAASVWSLAFSADGSTLASASLDNTVVLWDVATGRPKLSLKGHAGPVKTVAYARDGTVVASGGQDTTVRVWDLRRHARDAPLVGHSEGLDAVAFAPDGATLATGGRDGRILFWDVATGRECGRVESRQAGNPDGHPSHVRDLTYTPDGATLVAAGYQGPVRLWDVGRRALRRVLRAGPEDDAGGVVRLALAPDGRTLAVSHQDGRLSLRDVATGGPRAALPSRRSYPYTALAFAPDGRTLAASDAHDTFELWDVSGQSPVRAFRDAGPVYTALAFAPDGRTLAAGGGDGTLTLWDVAPLRPRVRRRGHTNELIALAFTPDGSTLATGGRDNVIRLWDVATGELKTALRGHAGNVTALRFAPDGRALASSSLDGTARLWLAPDAPARRPPARSAAGTTRWGADLSRLPVSGLTRPRSSRPAGVYSPNRPPDPPTNGMLPSRSEGGKGFG